MPKNREEKPKQTISSYVNQEHVGMLVSMGYTKDVSEKALFLSGMKSVEEALKWIEENKNQPDFNETLYVVGTSSEPGTKRSNMSKAEAEAKAIELQRELRKKREQREKEEEIQREKERIRGGKELVEARRALEEAEARRIIENKVADKKRDELDKRAMLEQLERDRAERFGKNYVAKKDPKDVLLPIFKQMKVVYPPNSEGPRQVLITCLSTVKIYLSKLH